MKKAKKELKSPKLTVISFVLMVTALAVAVAFASATHGTDNPILRGLRVLVALASIPFPFFFCSTLL